MQQIVNAISGKFTGNQYCYTVMRQSASVCFI